MDENLIGDEIQHQDDVYQKKTLLNNELGNQNTDAMSRFDDDFNINDLPVVLYEEIFDNSHEFLACQVSNELLIYMDHSYTTQHSDIPIDSIVLNEDEGNSQELINQVSESLNVELQNDEGANLKKKTRKRSRNPKKWKRNVRKMKHQKGESYISSRQKDVPAKAIQDKKNCLRNCKFNCSKYISEPERKSQLDAYLTLSQYMFISKSTLRHTTLRKKSTSAKRRYSFQYFFFVKCIKIRVCKAFYLATPCISQKPVYNVHLKMDVETHVPKPDMRGSKKHSKVSESQKISVRNHINSFPRVASHYCRAKTEKEYLEPGLNITKLYELYEEYCKDKRVAPVKSSMYRNIFVSEFNIDFNLPKNDRCDTCELYAHKNLTDLTEEEKHLYSNHLHQKTLMLKEKEADKLSKIPLLIFDLQNVITCPKTGVGSFFYHRKLNLYNLTAYFSTTKTKYCALWSEATAGRTGNDLASAFRAILDRVAEDNELTEIITWSDSCVPQNRNSFMSYAVLDFLKKNPRINKITMKYSTPGHADIQEVDNIHSQIENVMKYSEFYSPLIFIRMLKSANKKNPYRIIQMQPKDFKAFNQCAQFLHYKNIPFSKVCAIEFTQNLFQVSFKTSFEENVFTVKSLKESDQRNISLRRKSKMQTVSLINNICPEPKPVSEKPNISILKQKDIKTMFKLMPAEEQSYYKAIFSRN